jgi:hypothetical protein
MKELILDCSIPKRKRKEMKSMALDFRLFIKNMKQECCGIVGQSNV